MQLSGPSPFIGAARAGSNCDLLHRLKEAIHSPIWAIVAGGLNQLMPVEPQKQSGNPVDNRRTQRVLLRIPILVRRQFAGDAPIREETHTLVVNAHDALIALAMKVPKFWNVEFPPPDWTPSLK